MKIIDFYSAIQMRYIYFVRYSDNYSNFIYDYDYFCYIREICCFFDFKVGCAS